MKATGIERRIDDLGRVVVPKEIRRTLRLREGTPLEIFTDREGEIILKKYSPMMELNAFAGQYADAMAQSTGLLVCITDRDQVMQAEAAGIEPEAAMNPILLKPTSNMGSQLIVNGEVRGNYPAAEYFKMKKSLIPDSLQHSGIPLRCDRRGRCRKSGGEQP